MNQTTKFYRLLIHLGLWHLRPYYVKRITMDKIYKEWGWLCFKYIVG